MEIANPNDKQLNNVSVHQPIGLENNTLIFMKDHSTKTIGSIRIGDEILLGGKVTNVIRDKSRDIYNYKGTYTTGNMKVLEDGRWLKVEESQAPRRLTNNENTEITIIQSEIKILIASDYQIWSSNLLDVVVELNTKHELNATLTSAMKSLK